jgi:hypothetical protein
MAAHRYWRILVLSSGDLNGYAGFYEIELRTAIGGANVATGGTAFMTGRVFAGSAALAFNASTADGLILNAYDGGALGTCGYDFGAGNSKDIVEVGITPRNDGFYYQAPNLGALQYSDDNATWTTAFSWSVASWTFISEPRYFSATLPGTYFDHGNKTASVKLGTSNRLAATFSAVSTIAVQRPCSGLTYGEFTITTLTGTPAVGLVNPAYNYAVGSLLGADANSLGYRSGGAVVSNNVTLATIAAFVQGDRVDTAFDPDNRLIWFRVNGGNWNNNAANNPVTGVGGIAVPESSTNSLISARLAAGASVTGTVITGAFDTFVGTAPTGYQSPTTYAAAATKTTMPVVPGAAAALGPAYATMLPTYDRPNRVQNGSGPLTHVSGITKEGGVAAASKRVDVYDRNTGELIDTGLSDGSGNYSLAALGRPAVRVVGSDPTTYNSVAFDNVVPV